jgi:3-oxoacyl-[acyl-carrier protein] reductase
VGVIKTGGGDAIAIQADTTSSKDVERLFTETKRLFGRIDIVVANAGITGSPSPIASTTNEQFDRVFDINVKGYFYTLRAAANHIENNGRIIVIGSIVVSQGFGPYAASKRAVEVLANTAAQELGSKGVTVNTIHPGPIETGISLHPSSIPMLI